MKECVDHAPDRLNLYEASLLWLSTDDKISLREDIQTLDILDIFKIKTVSITPRCSIRPVPQLIAPLVY